MFLQNLLYNHDEFISTINFNVVVMREVMNVKYDSDCGYLLVTQLLLAYYEKFAYLTKEVLMWMQL